MTTIPNFIYVGAPKAGSSWLFQALSEHDDIFVTPRKSTTYFESSKQGPIDDYLTHFEEAGEASAIGEIAHDTFLDPNAAQRIHEAFPNMRILCCLREPGDFARSAMQWWQTHTTRYGATPDEMLKHERLLSMLDYPARVAPFFELFPEDQLKVVFFDELRSNPENFLCDIYTFLGVNPDFRPIALDRVVNPARQARFQKLTHLAYVIGGKLRTAGLGSFVENLKQSTLIKRILYASSGQSVTPEIEEMLQEIRKDAQPKLDKLEGIIGHSVPAAWRRF